MDIYSVAIQADAKGFKQTKTDTDKLNRSLKGTEKAANAVASSFGKMITGIGTTAAIIAATRELNRMVNAASDLEEATSKFNTVFASQISLAEDWSKTLNKSYGQSKREAKENLGAIQDLLVPMGMAEDAAGKLSFEVVKLATDLGSFNNKLTPQVIDDYQSALVGNYETMKKYGVVLNATTVTQKALEMGLARSKNELTASAKAQAAHQLIVEGSTAAIGDFIRTSDGYANTTKKLDAAWEDFAGTLGERVLPAATSVKDVLIETLDYWEQVFKTDSAVEQIKKLEAEIAATQKRIDSKSAPRSAFLKFIGAEDFKSSQLGQIEYKRLADAQEKLKSLFEYQTKFKAEELKKQDDAVKDSLNKQLELEKAAIKAQQEIWDASSFGESDSDEFEREIKSGYAAIEANNKRIEDKKSAELKYNEFILSHMDKTTQKYKDMFLESEMEKWSEVKGITQDQLDDISRITLLTFNETAEESESIFSGITENFTFKDFTDSLSESLRLMRDLFEQGSDGYSDLTHALQGLNAVQKINIALTQTATSAMAVFSVYAAAAMALYSALDSFDNDLTTDFEARQESQGTGTVFGYDDRKTNSIIDSLELIAKTNEKIVNINTEMLASLQSLSTQITQVTASTIRQSGQTQFTGEIKNAPPNKEIEKITGVALARAWGSTSGPIGAFWGYVLGTAAGKFLGGDVKVSDEGIRIVSDTMANLIEETNAQAYQDIKYKNWKYGDTHRKTENIDLSREINDQFSNIFKSIGDTVSTQAAGLGVSLEDINSVMQTWETGLDVSLKGMNAEEKGAAINAAFSQVFDNLTLEMVPWLTKLSKEGEGLGETISRVTTGIALYERGIELFGWMGNTFEDAGVRITIAGHAFDYVFATSEERFARATDALMELAGGAEQFASKMSNFFTKFAPEEKQFEVLTKNLTDMLGEVGLVLPDTREGFFDLMGTLRDTKDATDEQIAVMLNSTDLAHEYFNVMEDNAEKIMDLEDEKTEVALSSIQSQIDAYENSKKSIEDQIFDLKYGDTNNGTIDAGAYEARYAELLLAAQTLEAGAISDFQNFANEYLSVFDTLGTDHNTTTQKIVSDLDSLSMALDDPIAELSQTIKENTEAIENMTNLATGNANFNETFDDVDISGAPQVAPPFASPFFKRKNSTDESSKRSDETQNNSSGTVIMQPIQLVVNDKVLSETMINLSRTDPEFKRMIN